METSVCGLSVRTWPYHAHPLRVSEVGPGTHKHMYVLSIMRTIYTYLARPTHASIHASRRPIGASVEKRGAIASAGQDLYSSLALHDGQRLCSYLRCA